MTEQQPELLPQPISEISAEAQAKREEYRRRLAEYLKDPLFRAIEGFPIGSDEDILALSDPPYYTACPNPFLPEIIEQWQQEREETREKLGLKEESYQREPFAADVSEGKNHPIYNAHSYHTKVPHKAIMRYILHYTDPGDIVFDGFCGTGMTGVAAQLCGDRKAVQELGYQVDDQGVVWEGNKAISRLGTRKAVLNDLSPAATFIAYNYNTPVDATAFEREAKCILREVEQECRWMYETWHPNCDAPNRVKGKINYTVWSDVYVCPTCGYEMVFWDVAVDQEARSTKKAWNCPSCSTLLTKNPTKGSGALRAERAFETHFDRELKQTIRQSKQVPVLINYKAGKKLSEKRPDEYDLELIGRVEESETSNPIPIFPVMFKGKEWGDTWRAGYHAGVTHIHHFYTRRNLLALGKTWTAFQNSRFRFLFQSVLLDCLARASKRNRYMPEYGNRHVGILSGTLYIPTLSEEDYFIKSIIDRITNLLRTTFKQNNPQRNQSWSIDTTSANRTLAIENTLDYIFIDPPFGGNLMYSELNFHWEAWLRVFTNNQPEAIINNIQEKGLAEYQGLMQACFDKFYRILKPGRWMTIEFHNSQNAVWNSIQEAILRAGFVIADVRTLDKIKGTTKQLSYASAVKQDLVISAYKPNGDLEKRFKLNAGTEDGAWEFARYHLGKLPVVNESNGTAIINAERQAYLLYDRMVAFHVQRGVLVPISAPEFYAGLEQRFTRRDGMYFLPEQVAEYDRAMLDSGKPTQPQLIMTDEKTAITWLRLQLDPRAGGEPQTRGDLTNKFNQTMHRSKHEKALELIEILEQNFLQDENGRWYVPDHNKASDLDRVRHRSLLKEFNEYAASAGRLRQFRTEAVRAGFADCFKRQDYPNLIKVAERLPEDVLREDPDLLMYYDSALLRKK